jgi:Tol biopolymer transport system component
MVRNSDRLLTKEELMKSVWGDAFVEEGNLTQSVFLLRKALSANQPADNKLIVTVPGRGYRFAAQVEEIAGRRMPEVPANGNGQPHLPVEISEEPQLSRSRAAWIWSGAVLAVLAATTAGLIFIPRMLRQQATEVVPTPHPVTTNSVESPTLTVAISPDGRYLAYASAQAITIQTLKTSETRTLPVPEGVVPVRFAWYPDQTRVLVSERVNDAPVLLVFSILSGKLSPLRENAMSPSISADGTRILYTDGGTRELWLMDGNGENARRILTAPAPEKVWDKVYPMFFSPDGKRVWFARVHWDKGQETITLETCDDNGARGTVALMDNHASAFRLLPQGRLIYARIEGAQNFTNLWELRVNAAEGKPEGQARQITHWTNFSISGISATADGKHLALLNGAPQSDVYIGDLRTGGTQLINTRRLTLDQSDDSPAFWTPDDQAVIFDSNRNGRTQLFRQRLDQTIPELLSMDAENDDMARFGGPWIYFRSVPAGETISWDKPLGLRRIPVNGGASSEVLRDAGIEVSCATEKPAICVLARLGGKTLSFYHFDHEKGKGAEIGHMEYDSGEFPSFELSPDGLEIAAVNPKGSGNRIRLMPLHGGDDSEVEVRGRKILDTLHWAADGKGWFTASQTPANGEYLLHVNPRGESQVLFEQIQDGRDTWGIPSHDGKHLAFLEWTYVKNVWMIDGF